MTPAAFRKALKQLGLTPSDMARRMYAAELNGLSQARTAHKMRAYRVRISRWYHGVHRIPEEVTALLNCWKELGKD